LRPRWVGEWAWFNSYIFGISKAMKQTLRSTRHPFNEPSSCQSAKRKEEDMNEKKLSLPEIALIAGTRVALGAGVGLLMSGRLNRDQRRAAGLALVIVGGLSTIPLAMTVISKQRLSREELQEAA